MARAKAVANTGKALAYLRASSAQNVGGDSDRRQREAIERFARSHGHALVGEFHDAAVSGADPLETRPGFAAMLERIEGNGVRVVLVEDASRFARSVIAQELGVLAMQARGVRVLTASGEDLTSTADPAKVMMRQIAGAFAQYEKARLVAKLKGARDRNSAALGRRIEGRKGYAETKPELVRKAKRLARRSPKTVAAPDRGRAGLPHRHGRQVLGHAGQAADRGLTGARSQLVRLLRRRWPQLAKMLQATLTGGPDRGGRWPRWPCRPTGARPWRSSRATPAGSPGCSGLGWRASPPCCAPG
jgi:DNA invertase Pin-like site-specific DNA recombinase